MVEETSNQRMQEVASMGMVEEKGRNRIKTGGSCMENSVEW